MKLLLDQNISFRLTARIAGAFPLIEHVRSLGLTDADDFQIFMFARNHGFAAIFTQDVDFYNLLMEHGAPPKVVWLRTGNSSTASLAAVILRNAGMVLAFLKDGGQDCLEVFGD